MDNPEKLTTYRAHKTKKKRKKHTICVGHHHIQTHINNVNKACAFLQTTGGKYIIIKHTNYISPDEHTGDISIKNHSECVFSLSKLKQQNI